MKDTKTNIISYRISDKDYINITNSINKINYEHNNKKYCNLNTKNITKSDFVRDAVNYYIESQKYGSVTPPQIIELAKAIEQEKRKHPRNESLEIIEGKVKDLWQYLKR